MTQKSKVQIIKDYHKIQPVAARACGGLKQSSQNGRYFIGFCPFCQPQRWGRGKFWVDTELQICNCFKRKCASPKPMDVINFYARLNGIDNDQAIAELILAKNMGRPA